MNNKGQTMIFGFLFVVVGFIFLMVAFAFINPLIETFDNVRGDSALNCPGTPAFNQSDYDDDSSFDKLVKRPTCFVTGFAFLYFFLTFIIAVVVWIAVRWGNLKR